MYDWTKDSEYPNSKILRTNYLKRLKKLRLKFDDVNETLLSFCNGKRVLHVGCVAHIVENSNRPGWLHGKIENASDYVLGVDINEKAIEYLRQKGHNVKCVDATSDAYLGEKFDVVVLGHIIEHVNNPVALLEFAGRHISETSDSGFIIVTTPNIFSIGPLFNLIRFSTVMANFEHTCAILPVHMNELCRRANLKIINYYVGSLKAPNKIHGRDRRIPFPFAEFRSPVFLFKLGLPQS